jgi:hypothetical protein
MSTITKLANISVHHLFPLDDNKSLTDCELAAGFMEVVSSTCNKYGSMKSVMFTELM